MNLNSSDLRNNFEREGYVVFPDFLDTTQLDEINAEIQHHYAPQLERAQSGSPLLHDENFAQFECDIIPWEPCEEGNAAFLKLRDSADLNRVTAACIGENFQSPGSLVMLSIGGGKGQSWHQDCPPDDASQFNLNRLFYTEDVGLEDGAIVVVPGSHRMGRIPPGDNQENMEGEVVLTPRAGTLVLVSGHVYHRVTPNLSGKPRLSVNLRAFPAGVATDLCNVGVFRGGAYNFRERAVVQNSVAEIATIQ